MKKVFLRIVFALLVLTMLGGCALEKDSDNKRIPTTQEKISFLDLPINGSDYDQIEIRWGNGTRFVIEEEGIIKAYVELFSDERFVLQPDEEGVDGFLYYISLGDMVVDNMGIVNHAYKVVGDDFLDEVEALLYDYLPVYKGSGLEYQSDLMPNSHLYLVVKVDKCTDGRLYFTKHHNDYGFEMGITTCSASFQPGDIVEIETDGRLPEGETIEIVAYSIQMSE